MTLTLVAPMAGWVLPLRDVPDAAFSQGMVGDGVGLEPLEAVLRAPCAGTVVAVHRARHAVTLRAHSGADILCHVGIETVALDGDGFVAHVQEGDQVLAGTALLGFDLDRLADRAPSLATPVLLLDDPRFRVARRSTDVRVVAGDFLMEVERIADADGTAEADAAAATIEQRLRLPPGPGIHARPAAAIAACARRFTASVTVETPAKSVSATGVVALMTLGLAGGDLLTLKASGPDAEAALTALATLIEHDLESDAMPIEASSMVAPRPDRGVTAVPGIAVGPLVRLDGTRREPPATGAGITAETETLHRAVSQVRETLRRRAESGDGPQRAIAAAHLAVFDDAPLHAAAAQAIAAGASAGAAWRAALAPDLATLRSLADPRLAGRAADLLDLERQVIAATLGDDGGTTTIIGPGSILAGEDLLPSELMAIDPAALAGIALAGGGPTSHVAIIAAARGIPMVVALGSTALTIEAGTRVVLDADAGSLAVADTVAERAALARATADRERREAAREEAAALCHMADGERIEVFANLGLIEDAEAAMAAGAEGCGLLRTELLFLDRDQPPGEEEQRQLYQAIADRLGGRPLIIRTLDIGGDKPVPYLPIPAEENPALGLRGIRVGLKHPDLLDEQLRAILRLSPAEQARILVPMVASLDELVAVRRHAEAAARAVGHVGPLSIGVMIETPAAAIAADLLAPAADFFAIGTNDLAQYTLARDRGNPAVAADVDALHPAVLRLIEAACRAAAAHGRPVGVCGGLASDIQAAAVLIGLGVGELSAVPAVIPELKAQLRRLTRARCAALAAEAVRQPSAGAVRRLLAKELS